MLNIALFGPPGAGKGTQSNKLINKYKLAYISTGDMLRNEIAEGTKLGRIAKDIIDKGNLVSDEIIVQIIEGFIKSNTDINGVLFDGFPRTYVQAYILEGMLQRLDSKLSCMISLEVPKDELKRRMLDRAKISGRADDTEDVIENRFREYEQKTAPAARYYKERGIFNPINGLGSIDDIFSKIDKVVQNTLKDKLFNVVILGMPGSGKGTQSKRIADALGLRFISTGKLLRQEMLDKTAIGEKVSGFMRKGDIVPDELAIQIIEREINNNPDARGFIFKGFPRTIVQAYILDGILRKRNSSVSLVVDLNISMLEAFKRLHERGKTEGSRTYDANPETIIHRIEEYEEITANVPEYYRKQINVVDIEGNGSSEEVYERLIDTVEKASKKLR